MTAEPFQIRITVRAYELDTQGHLNSAVYHQYAEHTRWECLRAAGIPVDKLLDSGVGPVELEHTMRFHNELRGGNDVDVSCRFTWGDGKTFRIDQDFRRPDGSLAAELTATAGLLDLTKRRLVPDPVGHIRSLATRPDLLG